MLKRSHLPDEIILTNGETLKCVIGGHLENKPFLTKEYSGVDVTQNGWGNNLFDSQERQLIIDEAKRRKLKYRMVSVLPSSLRGKRDLHGSTYKRTNYVFVEVKDTDNGDRSLQDLTKDTQMDGTYIVIRRETGEAIASINAPYGSDIDNVLSCWVAGQGMSENARCQFRLDWFPITQWEGALENMLTPFCDLQE